MFSFQDAGGRELTLRPEGTAPICRAYVEHGMHKRRQPVKLWYLSSFFRHERAQAGRHRQFWQVGRRGARLRGPRPRRRVDRPRQHPAELARGAPGAAAALEPRQPREPRRLPREPDLLPARQRGRALGGGQGPHRSEPPAGVRLRTPRHPGRDAGRSPAAGPARGRRTRPTSRRCARCSTRRASPTRSIPRSCGASTTTPAPCSSSPPTPSAPRAGSGAGGATTASWRSSAGPPTPGIGWAAGVERILLAGEVPAAAPAPVELFVALEDRSPSGSGRRLRRCSPRRVGRGCPRRWTSPAGR